MLCAARGCGPHWRQRSSVALGDEPVPPRAAFRSRHGGGKDGEVGGGAGEGFAQVNGVGKGMGDVVCVALLATVNHKPRCRLDIMHCTRKRFSKVSDIPGLGLNYVPAEAGALLAI